MKTQIKIKKEKMTEYFRKTPVYKIYHVIETSATIGLLVTIAIFWYQTTEGKKETKQLVGDLIKIEQSLSTRYLGIFPNYLPEINDLFKNANLEKPTVIFQDVLYYGIFSAQKNFKQMIDRLLELSKTSTTTIVYYDINSSTFRQMVQEGYINQKYFRQLSAERNELRQKLKLTGDNNFYQRADSIVTEKYFALSRDDDKAAFEKKKKSFLTPLYDSETDIAYSIYWKIDEVKQHFVDKPVRSITFQDILKMYQGISEELIKTFKQHNIEIIGISEYLVMGCWLNDNKAILAFPSKYKTEEIGFYTQDRVFAEYINTMLEGVRIQYKQQH